MFLSKAPIRTIVTKATRLLASHTSNNGSILKPTESCDAELPELCDVAIIGGGAVGSSIAYWLKHKVGNDLKVVVVEKDRCYTKASTTLSVGGVRQQFSLEENIRLSLFAAEFLPNIKHHLGENVNLNLTSNGYLMLASEEGAECLLQNSIFQNQLGARNITLTAKQLKEKFPWLNTDEIALGCFGLQKEGWFDPYALLMGFKQKAQSLGANFVEGEVINFEFAKNPANKLADVQEIPNKIVVKLNDNTERKMSFSSCVIAAGAFSGEVAKKARIGNGPGLLSVPLPVVPRKRYVYVIKTQGQNAPDCTAPLAIDPNNTYLRPDGNSGNFLAGRSPDEQDEPDCSNLDVDYDYFDAEVWPRLAHRIPAFESVKMQSAWSGYYEYNTFDENGVIGAHPCYNNVYIATGFSGHGIQQSPAVGRAISELITDGRFKTIDLTRLGFERLIDNTPMRESNIV